MQSAFQRAARKGARNIIDRGQGVFNRFFERLIDSVVDSLNVWLNALTARQQLLGGRIEFREEDNSTTELMDGIYHFKVFMTPPSPAEDLEFDLEIDTDYYSTLFA